MRNSTFFIILLLLAIFNAYMCSRRSSPSGTSGPSARVLRHIADSLEIENLRLQNDIYLMQAHEDALIDSIISSNNNY